MPRLYKHSAWMAVLTLLLTALAYVLTFSVPDKLAEREYAIVLTRAEHLGQRLKSSIERADADSTHIRSVFESMRKTENVSYLILSDEYGNVLESLNEAGARHAGYGTSVEADKPPQGRVTVEAVMDIALSAKTRGKLYVGLQKASSGTGLRSFQQYFRLTGLMLILAAISMLATFRRVNRTEVIMLRLKRAQSDLASQKGLLESELSKHQQKEKTLQESEERYRQLLETAMESAFEDLERQKQELEIEIDQKTKAQRVLKKIADQLSALNVIERSIVDGATIDEVAQIALEQMASLIPVKRASVIQIKEKYQLAQAMGQWGCDLEKTYVEGKASISDFRPFEKGLLLEQNLAELTERVSVEDELLAKGILSYCRVSLMAAGSVAGSLMVGLEEAEAFGESELETIQEVADLLAIAFQQHLHKEEQQRYEKELIEERDRAEEMARLKTAFLTNMSHEIRTPLSGIIGFAQVLHEELPEQKREFTGLIQESAHRLLLTINSVLDLSKLQAHKESLHYQKLDVSKVVEETVRILHPLAERKGLELNIVTDTEAPAYIDRSALEAIINNLVGNAIKFTDEGSVTVSVRVQDETVMLEVQDTGVGISEEFVPYLFDEFRQEHMGSDRPHEGSGLGLAITSQLVVKMSGRIDVKSELGEGTMFRVSFLSKTKWRISDRDASAPTERHQAPGGTSSRLA